MLFELQKAGLTIAEQPTVHARGARDQVDGRDRPCSIGLPPSSTATTTWCTRSWDPRHLRREQHRCHGQQVPVSPPAPTTWRRYGAPSPASAATPASVTSPTACCAPAIQAFLRRPAEPSWAIAPATTRPPRCRPRHARADTTPTRRPASGSTRPCFTLIKPGMSTDKVCSVRPQGTGVRLPRRDGRRLRPAVRPRHRLHHPRAPHHHLPRRSPGSPHGDQGGHGVPRSRHTALPRTGYSAARMEEEVVVTDKGCRIITLFPAEELPIANRY